MAAVIFMDFLMFEESAGDRNNNRNNNNNILNII